jgi:thioredoxin reductase (NADPH)
MGAERVVILGGGPAAYTAALYAARADLDPVVIEGFEWGGQLQSTTAVDNFPGFTGGVQGPDLGIAIRDQAERFGARFVTDVAIGVELAEEPEGAHVVRMEGDRVAGEALILAMGAEHKHLGVEGEDELAGLGVSYCAICDAAFYKGARAIVVGGGDTAMGDAQYLARHAREVTVVHRRTTFRASDVAVAQARAAGNVSFLQPYEVVALEAGDDGVLARARLRDTTTGEERAIETDAAFIAIGHLPRTELVVGQLETDARGYIAVDGRSTRTSRRGVFAAGDIADGEYRQAVTAAAMGAQAAIDADRFLSRRDPDPQAEPRLTSVPMPAVI